MFQNKIIKINSKNPEIQKIQEVVQILKNKGVIIFPTDTLYGLGGNALDKKVIKKIYRIKKRSYNKPLSINIAHKKDLKKYVKKIPFPAYRLIKKFWPGPLTLIFKKSDLVPDELTAGLPYVGIRIPNNKIILKIIKHFGAPLISTSANTSGHPSPKNLNQAKMLFKQVDIVIDGGRTQNQKASTIIDFSQKTPKIIRKGALSLEKLKNI